VQLVDTARDRGPGRFGASFGRQATVVVLRCVRLIEGEVEHVEQGVLKVLASNELDHIDSMRVTKWSQIRVGRARLEERLAHRRRDRAAIPVDAQLAKDIARRPQPARRKVAAPVRHLAPDGSHSTQADSQLMHDLIVEATRRDVAGVGEYLVEAAQEGGTENLAARGVGAKSRALRLDGRRRVARAAREQVAARRLGRGAEPHRVGIDALAPERDQNIRIAVLELGFHLAERQRSAACFDLTTVERHFDLGTLPWDEQESPAHPRRMNELERRAVVASVESTGQETAGAGAGMQRQIGPRLGTGIDGRATHCFLETLRRARPRGLYRLLPAAARLAQAQRQIHLGEAQVGSVPVSRLDPDRFRTVPDHGALDGRHRGRDDPELQLGLVHHPILCRIAGRRRAG
jgi:hypothetical protein